MAVSIADVKRNLRLAEQKQLQANADSVDSGKRKLLLRQAQQMYQKAVTMARQLYNVPDIEVLKKTAEHGFGDCKRLLNQMNTQERRDKKLAAAADALSVAPDEPVAEVEASGDETVADEAPAIPEGDGTTGPERTT